jgi:hypothetical protein
MKFDLIIGNPPYNANTAKEESKSLVKGNRSLYKTFTVESIKFLKPNGVLTFVTLKNIYKDFYENTILSKYEVPLVNMMLGSNVWEFNTCYFQLKNTPRTSDPYLTDPLLRKIFNPSNRFQIKSGGSKSFSVSEEVTPYPVVTKLPGRHGEETVTYSLTEGVDNGVVKLGFTMLISKISFLITDKPIHGPYNVYVNCNSIKEAEQLKNFLLSDFTDNLLKKLNVSRGYYDLLRLIKKFDLTLDLSKEENIKKVLGI